MQCSSCGAHLAPGATTCPLCGRPTPYNVPGSGASDPTVVAPPAGPPPPPQPPPTAYGSFSSGPASPYGTPPYTTPPSPPYPLPPVSPSSAQQYPYATPPSAPYPLPPASPSSAQQQSSGLSTPFPPAPMPGSFGPPPPQGKRRGRFIALLVGVVGLILVLSVVGILLVPRLVGSLGPTIGPSGSPVTTGLLSNVQEGSAADSNCQITQPGSTVTVGQTLYIAFDLHLNGQTGYIQAKFYRGQEFLVQTNVLAVAPGVLKACAYASFPEAIPNGIAELYWCQQADCSDGKLAAVTHFIVTAASSHLAAPGQAVTVALLTERSRILNF